ncbi:MAG: hypothetical protein A2204_07360 [Elusimicrobia bacterium RIFOXYA1_FULL_47_7]|nr:MAG: hypothetical protein A2278_07490 [Elusimicrobia bacterium RIFOXYA12_FULL_49_49]OGS10327.1 MAG: hypothetical protein A2204_07360 [Elusimicrobia bacterium RIFOXYA1_FULL_47_7]OGS11106.1 MAG: hypothetical protein A2386_05780 [Elusimicrobia bacterium RIFOXYB1_FULL_48_9]OGS16091.1 MAG: hypothetical protein A2251_02775 [Elusimicrobia bacterium RIFOXYA2_FULL_47_53]OGS26717.1 MAG: hypothetical protein A2339_03825 [Elusimicrobia bacterium RIFOXYB12_FULL_50_12]OGS30157.1 MAG: hypothetical protein
MVMKKTEYLKVRKTKMPDFIIKTAGWLFPYVIPSQLRMFLLKLMGVKLGKKIYIGRMTLIDDNFPELLTIEDDVIISYGCMIFMHDASKPDDMTVAPVTIKKGAYLGLASRVLQGVTIGENAVVGACALVTKDVAPGQTVIGIPARPIEKKM